MASIFEALMLQNHNVIEESELVELTESVEPSKVSNPEVKKFNVSKFKFESRRVFESESFDELDKQFAVDPESEDEGEVVLVIDPEVSTEDDLPEDAAEQAIGSYVYKCPVCGSNYLCNCDAELEEAVEVDDNGVPTECPICGDDADQILIGEIAPVEGAGEEKETLDPVEPEDAEDNSDEDPTNDEGSEDLEEGLFGKKKDKSKGSGTFKVIDGQHKNTIKGGFKSKDDAYSWIEDNKEPDEYSKFSVVTESVNIQVEDNVDATVTVTPEATEAPVECTDDTCEKTVPEVVETTEADLDFDEVRFESLINKSLDNTFKASPKMKVESIKIKGSKLIIEYKMHLGKKTSNGTLHCEGFDINKKIQRVTLKDKGIITESVGRESKFEARAMIRNGKLSIF